MRVAEIECRRFMLENNTADQLLMCAADWQEADTGEVSQ